MGNFGFVELGVFVIIYQALALGASEKPTCQPGFRSDLLVFEVDRSRLHIGRVLGEVGFSDCSSQKKFVFRCADSRFRVDTDGTLKVKREVALHGGHKDFSIHAWDSHGHKSTVHVRVVNIRHHDDGQRRHHAEGHGRHHDDAQRRLHAEGHGRLHAEGHGRHHDDTQRRRHAEGHGRHHDDAQRRRHAEGHGRHHGNTENHQANWHAKSQDHNATNVSSTLDLPVLHFPKASSSGLIRKKRAWVIPPINFPENDRGPFPKQMVQIKSDNKDKVTIEYSITGSGADQPPVGLFTCNRLTGWLSVTQPLDREKRDTYKLQAHAVATGLGVAEDPMDIYVNVIDQNDNKPVFVMDPFIGQVPEASPIDYDVVQVNATDADEPGSLNSDVRYTLVSQDPPLPSPNMFDINAITGWIRVSGSGLDRETYPQYTLVVQAADMEGNGLTASGKVILTVTDSNDNAPQFVSSTYLASVPENTVGALVVKMPVTDGDEPNTPAWAAVFKIVSGDPEGRFAVATGPSKQEGIITTAKDLDFENKNKYTLLVAVANEVPFAVRLPTATATVTVTVEDLNEAPVFSPPERLVVKREDLKVGSDIATYTATDPDTARKQTITYKIQQDDAGWLSVDKDTGVIKVKSEMDRESSLVKNNRYTALISATDNDEIPATGTGTLQIQLEDVNDNGPTIVERAISVCNRNSAPQLLSITDKDGPGFTAPYTAELMDTSKNNWTIQLNETKTGLWLTLTTPLEQGMYLVMLRLFDNLGMDQVNTIQANVCDCSGPDVNCIDRQVAGLGLSAILGVLGAILLLLLLVLLLMMYLRKKVGKKEEPLLKDDDVRDNIYYYDEEGGGEDDQDYDLSVIHRGLDNRPEVYRNDVIPNFMPAPQYRPRPENPEDIGCFIVDNLKAADNDPTAPPYDSLLVFDYEGAGSEAGSLSSLNSSSSGDQDYDRMNEWGPRFKKLADMYGGGEEDDMM